VKPTKEEGSSLHRKEDSLKAISDNDTIFSKVMQIRKQNENFIQPPSFDIHLKDIIDKTQEFENAPKTDGRSGSSSKGFDPSSKSD